MATVGESDPESSETLRVCLQHILPEGMAVSGILETGASTPMEGGGVGTVSSPGSKPTTHTLRSSPSY